MALPPAKAFSRMKPFVVEELTPQPKVHYCSTFSDAVKLSKQLRKKGKVAKAYKPLPPRL